MQSRNIISDNILYIAERFPNVITETIGENGKVVHSIDFDKLHQELTTDIVEVNEERYQFSWPGKRDAVRLANAPIDKTLRPCREESVDFDNTQNLYIEGDNLDVLKLLQENYLGKVKMIYIDPPYNTGNDFVYADDFGKTTEKFKGESGLFDEEGNQLADHMVRNTESNGRFHTDWLNMIYPRLKVARNLLSEDGVIFISIDDNEQRNLKCICDEIFGENNFVAQIVWQKRTSPDARRIISAGHEYVLVYVKTEELGHDILHSLPLEEKDIARFKNPDNDPNGPWVSTDCTAQGGHGTKDQFYDMVTPSGRIVKLQEGLCWRYTKKRMEEEIAAGHIWFGADGQGVPRKKTYLSDRQGKTMWTWWPNIEVGHTQEATKEVASLFEKTGIMDFPKPLRLMKRIAHIASDKDSVIVDFFSGSATTAHAVMQLNAEDGGNRKFILIQLPEKTDESSEAYKAGYKNICEIGKERIRRAGKKILEEHAQKNAEAGLFANQDETPKVDVGFRVLKLDSSNMNEVYYTPEEFDVNSLFNENIKSDRTEEDLLFQVMLDLGIELSAKIEKSEIAGKTVWSVSDGYLLACFDEDVNESAITAIAKQQPIYFVMRDSSLASDNVADNFDQIFEEYSKDTIRKIL